MDIPAVYPLSYQRIVALPYCGYVALYHALAKDPDRFITSDQRLVAFHQRCAWLDAAHKYWLDCTEEWRQVLNRNEEHDSATYRQHRELLANAEAWKKYQNS